MPRTKKSTSKTYAKAKPEKKKRQSTAQPIEPQSTREQLSSIIKTARQLMRKDAGLSGELDRLPQLSWVLFLKCYDDLEANREAQAPLGNKYKPVIPKGYRWRDWAADADRGRTGPELLTFVNADLLPALRELDGSNERQVIKSLFAETHNRMQSGYLLRQLVDLINGIHFNSKDEIFTLSHLYESMLKEMRDAAGDSGELYTPRPVVKFLVERVAPKIGQAVLDPAAGTCGMLAEAYAYLKPQARKARDAEWLQTQALHGVEKKPLPYLLGTMNLILHGVDAPNIRRGNALIKPLREIGEDDRYGVIVTNPPFGGEEEPGIQDNFPEATRTSETALLFLQFIMRSLKTGGRCGMVVPNGTLFGDGVAARVKEKLLKDFNLHTIVRLPNGVFAPYTSIPTNLLFFDRTGPTNDIWYYELPLPEGRKNYSKTKPLQFEEFADCTAWWPHRTEGAQAWRVDFRALYDDAIARATPHWTAAEQAGKHANDLARRRRELQEPIKAAQTRTRIANAADPAEASARLQALIDQQAELQARELEARTRQQQEQAAGDAIYWPIYNLDLKNPSAQDDFVHLPPEQLAADVLQKAQRIAEIMAEVQKALADKE
jgi:type I restriction enzyme M protein